MSGTIGGSSTPRIEHAYGDLLDQRSMAISTGVGARFIPAIYGRRRMLFLRRMCKFVIFLLTQVAELISQQRKVAELILLAC